MDDILVQQSRSITGQTNVLLEAPVSTTPSMALKDDGSFATASKEMPSIFMSQLRPATTMSHTDKRDTHGIPWRTKNST